MKSLKLFFAILLASSFYLLASSHASRVNAVTPFAPFSTEGNPPEKYYYDQIFPLFRYIRPAFLKVYENRDRSRNYEDLQVCAGGDRRDPTCSIDLSTGKIVDECEGGEVDLCYQGVRSSQVAQTAHSKSGNCQVGSGVRYGGGTGIVTGHCVYRQTPKVTGELKATDFSAENSGTAPSQSTSTTTPSTATGTPESQTPATDSIGSLVYPKLQNEACRYGCYGTDNPITWGSHRLSLDLGEQAVKQLLVVTRAKQTKSTLAQTGEWPLGWVDWGYKTPNGTTLEEIRDELPGGLGSAGTVIAEGVDDFFLNAGNLDAVSDTSKQREFVKKAVTEAAAQKNPPKWVTDLLQAPIYSPSFRQGYARGSICVWDKCCPGLFCPFPDAVFGKSKGLYADTSVSQTFGAALDDLILNYNLTEGAKIFRKLAVTNPLIRFAGSASPNAIPSVIDKRLKDEVKNDCIQYIPGFDDFTLGRFGFFMDYANPPKFFDGAKKCPYWAIQPELTKEKGGAFPQSLLSQLISLVWGGGTVDDVDMVKFHLITIPDAMGQSISEIETPVFDERDVLSENEKNDKYNASISNIVDATSEFLTAGKGVPVGDAKRRLAVFSCADPDYSNPQMTSIESYALGTRIGCYNTAAASSVCDGSLWNEKIGDTELLPLPQAVDTIKNSKMFVGGQLNPDLAEAYAQVEKETGVPCEVLAGHHFEEATGSFFGNNSPDQYSAANGGYVGKNGFLESVRNAAKGVLRHPPTSIDTLITEMSDFNGGGNSNCQLGFPVSIPYSGCPKKFDGEDDPYAVNMLDARHSSMYLLYCGDFKMCIPPKPYGTDRPGALAAALVVHSVIKGGAATTQQTTTTTTSTTTSQGTANTKVNPAGSCGDGYIDSALGCIPYSRDAFISALLSFVVGISGLISLVVMMVAAVQIMTAAGKKEQLTKGKELFAAGFTGLLFIIFSVTLLRIIAGDIIKIPGF